MTDEIERYQPAPYEPYQPCAPEPPTRLHAHVSASADHARHHAVL